MEEQSKTSQEQEAITEEKRSRRGATKLKEENEALVRALSESKAEAEQLRDRWMRAVADLENFRKRSSKEREDFLKFACESLIRDLLPILDNLQRAIAHGGDPNGHANLLEGIQMVERQFNGVLERLGVVPIQSLNREFDPSRHEAMLQVESGGHKPNTIVQELEKGYLLHDRLLRPAKVAVSKRTQT
jgi:molecular chaperone GrpE